MVQELNILTVSIYFGELLRCEAKGFLEVFGNLSAKLIIILWKILVLNAIKLKLLNHGNNSDRRRWELM